jgi:hypothetical protein
MAELRKTIELPVFDEHVTLDVTWRLSQIVESTYNMSALHVATNILTSTVYIQRRHVAEIIAQWVSLKKAKWTRSALLEHVHTCSPSRLAVYIGCIQAVVLYTIQSDEGDRRLISEDSFDLLSQGKDLPPEPEAEQEDEDSEEKKDSESS